MKSLDFSFPTGLALVAELRPDLVTTPDRGRERVVSAGERVFSRHKLSEETRVFKQAELVTQTLANLQLSLRGRHEPPAPGEPAELPHGALKTGELLPPPSFLSRKNRSQLGKGTLPPAKLTPSRSDLSAHSSSKQLFKPLLKEKGLNNMEESARKGLEALSITDTLLGIVMDTLDGASLQDRYTRRPTKDECLQIMLMACKHVAYATDAVARCYLDAVLVKRDSFLNSADKLDPCDRSALRSLPIMAPALIGPHVALNVEKAEKRQFDVSVRKIVSKAGGQKSSPRKRFSHPDSHPSPKFRRGESSSSRTSTFSKRNTGRSNQHSNWGKPKPKGSAHPQ